MRAARHLEWRLPGGGAPSGPARAIVGSCAIAFSAGCGSSGEPITRLSQLSDIKLLALVDYNPPLPPPTPGVAAALQFAGPLPCPSLKVTATLDGIPLAYSPGVSGAFGNGCQLGFYLEQDVASAPHSVLAFSDGVDQSSLTATNLLEARTLSSTLVDGGATSPGDVISFAWSAATDTIALTDAFFSSDAGSVSAATQSTGTAVQVTVPPLAPGPWTLEVDVVARPPIVDCADASVCSVEVSATTDVAVTVP